MGSSARHTRIDDDEVRPIELLAFEQVLQRYRMCLGGIAAHDEQRLCIADVIEAVRHGTLAPGICHTRDPGGMTCPCLVTSVVRSPERLERAEEICGFIL